jgi:hypothetical protein
MEHADVNHKCRFGGMAKMGKESCLSIDEIDKGTNCLILRGRFSSID